MKKIFPLFLLAATCLASCGNKSVAGKYSFLLGRQGDDETRVGITIELKDDKYVIPEGSDVHYSEEEEKLIEERGKKFTLSLDLGSAFDELMKELGLEEGIGGYYMVLDDVDDKYGNKMALGMDFDIGEGVDFPLSSEVIKNLLVSYVGGGKITLQLPVSLQDLQHQLVWYSGQYIDFDPYIKTKIHDIEDIISYLPEIYESLKIYDFSEYGEAYATLPGPQGEKRFGSHPEIKLDDDDKVIKNEIQEMNDKYAGFFSNTFIYDRVTDERLGSVYTVAGVDKLYFFNLDLENPAEEGVFDASIKVQGLLGTEQEVDVKVSLTKENDKFVVSSIKADGAQPGYEADADIPLEDYQKEAFVFRDFHDMKAQLTKE